MVSTQIRVLGCSLLLLCASSPLCWASDTTPEPTYAEILTDSTFKAKMLENVWMVDFFAPWCGHCKKLAPEMDKLVGMVDGTASVGTVDATSNKATADAYNVHGYPTLMLFSEQGQKVTTFKGPRDAEHIAAFIHKMLGPTIEVLTSRQQLLAYQSAHPTSFVLLPVASSAVEEVFQSLALERQPDVYCARTEVALDEPTGNAVIVALNDGKIRASFESDHPKGLYEFIEDHHMPLCPELQRTTFWDFANSPKHVVLALLDPAHARASEIQNWLCSSAKKNTKYRYAWMDSLKHDQLLGSMSVTQQDMPVVLMLDSPSKIHYVHRNTSWSMDAFIQNVEAGNVPKEGDGASWMAWIKSHMLGFCVVCFVAVIGFFIWLGDPSKDDDRQLDAKKVD